jgi:hypothetical protein
MLLDTLAKPMDEKDQKHVDTKQTLESQQVMRRASVWRVICGVLQV